jgi:hypothetical protein
MRVYADQVDRSGDEGGIVVGGCIYRATLLLRWCDYTHARVLQQAWICDHGHYEWRDIEIQKPEAMRAHPTPAEPR